jgi:hypothetical protein
MNSTHIELQVYLEAYILYHLLQSGTLAYPCA